MRIADGVFWKAAWDPDKLAMRMEEEYWSYGRLAAAAAQYGRAFRQLGGQPGDVVALHLDNSPLYLALFLGLAHAGFVVAPLNPRLPEMESEAMVQHIQPWRIVHETDGRPVVDIHLPGQVPSSHAVLLDALCQGVSSDWDGLDDGLSDTDLFYLGCSSGTTGQPKGVLRTHKSWTESFFGMTLEFGMNSDTTLLVPGPFCYSASLIAALHALFIGGTVWLQRRFDAATVANHLASGDIQAVFMVPAMYRSVLDATIPLQRPAGIHPITCVSAGDKLPPSLQQAWLAAFPKTRWVEYFGSSEVGFISVMSSASPSPDAVGRPFFPARVRVAGTEIQVKSGMGFSGYTRESAALLASVQRPQGYLASGDCGYLDADGILHLTGRMTDLIICGGVNIHPAEIEQVAQSHPAVREACAVGLPDARLGEVPVCVVVLHPAHSASLTERWNELQAFLQPRLAGYKRPRQLHLWPELPRNASGKLDRRAVRAALLAAWSESGRDG
ncbi:putative acyl--CoA ligase YhfT [Alicyclobacillus contaminans]|uniref:class I adenylate-forming enzyme family protein n=1 Tax=Alicyclobacillus contaminans TaxID=392016 RepID=UPI0004081F6F|nr:class I adenylate-forming enzyme family protein [Alicyclobacillus contaminans]GMA50001.1 putative acyl--CoA ligase YhfT [Alicyclobacillus contaminans]